MTNIRLMAAASTLALVMAGTASANDREPQANRVEPMATPKVGSDLSSPNYGPGQMAREMRDHRWTSYQHRPLADQPFRGAIATNAEAEDLLGAEIVNPQGQLLGQVSDLLIGNDGNIDYVVVSQPVRGQGTRPDVVVRIGDLSREQGAGAGYVLRRNANDLAGMPAVNLRGNVWEPTSPPPPAMVR